MSDEVEWINEVSQVYSADDDSLKNALLTCDGRGKDVKTAALEELIRRSWERGYILGKGL